MKKRATPGPARGTLLRVSMQRAEDLPAPELLARYVAAHNRGVREGAFDALLDLFARDAVFSFVGIPAGPFRGSDEIRRAFAESPPDDELVIGSVTGGALEASAGYAWQARPQIPEGTIHLRARAGRIEELRVVRVGAAPGP